MRSLLLLGLIGLLLVGPASAFDPVGWLTGKVKRKLADLPPINEDSAKKYLQDFGYVSASALLGTGGPLQGLGDSLKSAVRKFQEFAGLEPTGTLDIRTRKKMAEPRCGVFDVRAITATREDVFKWKKNRLTYSIHSYSTDLSNSKVKQAIRKAFDTWSAAVPLDFTEVSPNDESADIKIKFASGSHGDPWPFDGKGGVLAHATMPTSGLLHFDEAENWVVGPEDADKIASYRYTDLLPVAIHESGHALGLEHSRSDDSIMAPFYQESVDSNGNYIMPKLHSVDVRAIQEIYGARRGGFSPSSSGSSSSSGFGGSHGGDDDSFRTTTRRPQTTTERRGGGGLFDSLWSKWMGRGDSGSTSSDRERNRTPKDGSSGWDSDRGSSAGFGGSRGGSGFGGSGSSGFGGGSSSSDRDTTVGGSQCPSSVDAITEGPAGSSYLFSGSKVYEMHGTTVTRTHSLRLLFPNGPIYVEAAYFNARSNVMVLFQSFKVYVFDYVAGRFSLDPSYPKRIPSDIGFNPTGAMTWVDGSHVLFSRNDDFAIFDEYWNQATKVDKVSRYFSGLPRGIRGGLAERSGNVNVFTQSSVMQYDASRKMPGSERRITDFLGC